MWQFVQQNVILCGAIIVGFLGIISQFVLQRVYDGMIRDMKNPEAPKGKYMKQLKQKYNTYRRVQNTGGSIQTLIQKSLMDFRFMRMHLHTWRRLGGLAFILCLALGIGSWYQKGMGVEIFDIRNKDLWIASSCGLLILASYLITDTGYRKKYLETGLCSVFMDMSSKTIRESEFSDRPAVSERAVHQPSICKKKEKHMETQAQKDKRELKENLEKLKEGIRETAAETERSRERNTEILKQMDPSEQERIIREVLKEFLS